MRLLKPEPDPEKFENRIRIHAKTPDRTGSGSATLFVVKILHGLFFFKGGREGGGAGGEPAQPNLCFFGVLTL